MAIDDMDMKSDRPLSSISQASMVTVRLSAADIALPADTSAFPSFVSETHDSNTSSRRNSFDILFGPRIMHTPALEDYHGDSNEKKISLDEQKRQQQYSSSGSKETHEEEEADTNRTRPRSGSASSDATTESIEVDWTELTKTEESELKDEGTDESAAFLLARLEQENNTLATDPRFGLKARSRAQSRPPSIQVLKRLIQDRSLASPRYSQYPEPPQMTELEFWAALVKDYPQTAQKLPTLTSHKIKSGVPAPLRSVVWVSMAGARDPELGDEFDRLCEEPSPYGGIIAKDVGRSFPAVEMFRDSQGEGQKMLGRVLTAFSLYNQEVGYCQGLGFLTGPLLMHMGDKDAFCVLVRLMENYDLQSCFLPSLSGLHLRIYQFQKLLNQHLPILSAHLASLQVEAAYLSQWFLSFFAVTCPLEMLFRIYDVIFAEGASETIMRVALSLMRRNEKKMLQSHEFEEVMQLLLSSAVWETYEGDADDLVNDFAGFTGLVTRESLKKLEISFREVREEDIVGRFAFFPDVGNATSKFFGRLWTAHGPAKSAMLAPHSVAGGTSRPVSMLRKSPSKQSIASTTNSSYNVSEATRSSGSQSSDATLLSRDSAGEYSHMHYKTASTTSGAPNSMSKEDRDLHGQIEDLLTAMSEMQRDHAVLVTQLQREREERNEDHRAFRQLVHQVKSTPSRSTIANKRRTAPMPIIENDEHFQSEDVWGDIVTQAEDRLSQAGHERSPVIFETKKKLRDSLTRSKDMLNIETSRSQELYRQLDEQEKATDSVKEQLRETRNRLRESLEDKQRLEKIVNELRSRTPTTAVSDQFDKPMLRRAETADVRTSVSSLNGGVNGLRELRLGRPTNSPVSLYAPQQSLPRRTTSLATQAILSTEDHTPAAQDDLLVELVNAKTSEATARQELEEMKGKVDALKKMLGPSSPSVSTSSVTGPGLNEVKTHGSVPRIVTPQGENKLATPTPAAGGVGNFWGWGRRSFSTTGTPEKASS